MDFDGQNSGILIDNLTDTCVSNLQSCINGFTVAFWIQWKQWDDDYIVSSSWLNMKHFTEDTVPVEVSDGTNYWRIFGECFLVMFEKKYYFAKQSRHVRNTVEHSTVSKTNLICLQISCTWKAQAFFFSTHTINTSDETYEHYHVMKKKALGKS